MFKDLVVNGAFIQQGIFVLLVCLFVSVAPWP